MGAACAGSGHKEPTVDDTATTAQDDTGPAGDSDHDDSGSGKDHTGATDDSADTAPPSDPVVTVETADPALEWADPCITQAAPVQMGTVVDTALNELSGIAVSRRDPNVLWMHEDHAGEASIYAMNAEGDTLAIVTLDGATNNDWEDIATGPCGEDTCLYIGEIGNNDLDRTELGVYVLPEPDLATIADGAWTTTEWSFYGYTYPDGAQNAEALAVTQDGLPVVLSKHFDLATSNVYQFPSLDAAAETTLTLLGTIATVTDGSTPGVPVTAADLWPDASRLIFRTYASVYEVDLSAGLAAIASAPITQLTGAVETGGEAIAYDPWRGGFWQVSEGVSSEIWYIGCAE